MPLISGRERSSLIFYIIRSFSILSTVYEDKIVRKFGKYPKENFSIYQNFSPIYCKSFGELLMKFLLHFVNIIPKYFNFFLKYSNIIPKFSSKMLRIENKFWRYSKETLKKIFINLSVTMKKHRWNLVDIENKNCEEILWKFCANSGQI